MMPYQNKLETHFFVERAEEKLIY